MNQSTQNAVREHSESTQRAHKEQSESTQSTQNAVREQSEFVIPSEPKILHLVKFALLGKSLQTKRNNRLLQ